MAKAPKFGISYYKGVTPRKRPGRHKKRRNKHEKRMGKYRKKGGWQQSLDILYSIQGSWVWALIITAHKESKYEKTNNNE